MDSIREIRGIKNGNCEYFENITGDGTIICNYPENLLNEITENYKLLLSGKPVDTYITNESMIKTIDGKEFKDPINDYGEEICVFKTKFQEDKENCEILPYKLRNCETFSCTIKIPFGGIMKYEIVEMKDNHCIYNEGIIGEQVLNCNLTENYYKLFGEYYQNELLKEKDPTSIEIKEKFNLSGKFVSNPFEEALLNKECVININ